MTINTISIALSCAFWLSFRGMYTLLQFIFGTDWVSGLPGKDMTHFETGKFVLTKCTGAYGTAWQLDIRQNIDDSNPCGPEATCSVSGQVSRYQWRPLKAPSTFTAFTIVTIINTVSDTTETSTIVAETPENYALPPTNSEGKRTQAITYQDQGVTKTTTMYARPFLPYDGS